MMVDSVIMGLSGAAVTETGRCHPGEATDGKLAECGTYATINLRHGRSYITGQIQKATPTSAMNAPLSTSP